MKGAMGGKFVSKAGDEKGDGLCLEGCAGGKCGSVWDDYR